MFLEKKEKKMAMRLISFKTYFFPQAEIALNCENGSPSPVRSRSNSVRKNNVCLFALNDHFRHRGSFHQINQSSCDTTPWTPFQGAILFFSNVKLFPSKTSSSEKQQKLTSVTQACGRTASTPQKAILKEYFLRV